MARALNRQIMGKCILVFVTCGTVADVAVLAANIPGDYSSAIFATILAIPAMAITARTFSRIYAGENLFKVLFSGLPVVGLLAVLILFGAPKPAITHFHSWAILYGVTGAFLLSVCSGGLSRFLRLRLVIPAIFIPWLSAVVIDVVACWLLEPIMVRYPNGVMLGYNLFFLFYPTTILILLFIYPVQPLSRPRGQWVVGVFVGGFLGDLFSVPAIMLLFTMMKHGLSSFVVAQLVRTILINFCASVFAALGEKCITGLPRAIADADHNIHCQEPATHHCYVCAEQGHIREMVIVRNLITDMRKWDKLWSPTQNCFQCARCGRLTCWTHSTRSRICTCGGTNWIEKMYIQQELDNG